MIEAILETIHAISTISINLPTLIVHPQSIINLIPRTLLPPPMNSSTARDNPMTSSIAGESSMMSSSFTEVPVHLFALGFLESTIAWTGFLESMIPWTQAEETEETRQ